MRVSRGSDNRGAGPECVVTRPFFRWTVTETHIGDKSSASLDVYLWGNASAESAKWQTGSTGETERCGDGGYEWGKRGPAGPSCQAFTQMLCNSTCR